MSELNVSARAVSQKVAALPKFIQEDHRKFVSFMEAYYKWSATHGADLGFEAMKLANDIDLVPAELLPKFREVYAPNFPVDAKADFRLVAKHLKEIYSVKGTDESYRIFYQAAYGESVQVRNPKDRVFKPSDAVWSNHKVMLVKQVTGNPFELVGHDLNGWLVESVMKSGDLYALELSGNGQEFQLTDNITSEGIVVSIQPVYAIGEIESSINWKDGETATVDGLTFKVDQVHYGKVMSVTVMSGGTGYKVDDVVELTTNHLGSGFRGRVSAVSPQGAITRVSIDRRGWGFNNRDVTLSIQSAEGKNAKLSPVFTPDMGKIKHASIIKNTAAPTKKAIQVKNTRIALEQAVFHNGHYWTELRSAPSTHHAMIHDSSFYQDYSYELVSGADVDKAAVQSLLGVAGMKLYTTKKITWNP